MKKEIRELINILTNGIKIDEDKEHFKEIAIRDLLENGANPEILNMTVIQNIFNYELSRPVDSLQKRAFSYSPNYREIRKDGTFDIAPCTKDYKYTFPMKIDYKRYVIKYCDKQTYKYHIQIACPSTVPYEPIIYLDRNGNISEVKTLSVNEQDNKKSAQVLKKSL